MADARLGSQKLSSRQQRRLRRVGRWWEAADRVIIACIALPLLGLIGFIGAGDDYPLRPEHFTAKQVIVQPVTDDGLRITEVVDIDFARNHRHGYRRTIPHDFGAPTDVIAASTANADVDVDRRSTRSTIRIGSPDITFRGEHRYRLAYTLPDAELGTGRLSLDIIGTDETLTTDRLDVWITGLDLTDVDCDRGRWAAEGGCEFVEVASGRWRASIDDLQPGNGITVNAEIVGRVAGVDATGGFGGADLPLQPRPAGWSPDWMAAALLLATCIATLAVLYLFSRWIGTNRVADGGATSAAFADGDNGPGDVPHRRVVDARLADLATIEFEPPNGLRPWQGAIALNEAIDEQSIIAWFSEMIAIGALHLDVSTSGRATFSRGEGEHGIESADAAIIDGLFRERNDVSLGRYTSDLSVTWKRVARLQENYAAQVGWWHRSVPTYRSARPAVRPNWSVITYCLAAYAAISLLIFKSMFVPFIPIFWAYSHISVGVVTAVGAMGYLSYRAFAPVRPARTVLGTAAALRVLSFRRFLEASEGRHVDLAWDRERIREYSAWAVALDAATAWAEHVEVLPAPAEPIDIDWAGAISRVSSTLDLDQIAHTRPRYAAKRANPWRATGKALGELASFSGGEGSGGFSSGGSSSGSSGVGSGGGGGSSGSW